jgi:arylsulfate sulfotransferase
MREALSLLFVLVSVVCHATAAGISVNLISGLASPQPVGTPIALTVKVADKSPGLHAFRFAVSMNGGPFRIVRDFSQSRDFAWMPALFEHDAAVRVTARNNDTKETAEADTRFHIVARATSKSPFIAATSNPLVALFSGPPCPKGNEFRVAFRAEGEESISRTPPEPCRGTISSNVLVAGMRADTEYRMRSEWNGAGGGKHSEWLPFRTGILDGNLAPVSVAVPRSGRDSGGVIIYSAASAASSAHPLATDLQGRVVWYLRSADFLTRVLPGGHFLVLAEGDNSSNTIRRNQLLRELDLAGNIIRETNASRVAEQLESRAIHSECRKGGKECLSAFHHEAIRLPNGHTLAVTGLERMMPAGTQGAKDPVDILGDVVVELDEEFQVVGMWNGFDHLDVNRASLGNSKCQEGPGRGGCAAVFLASQANGWTHSNALNYIPSSGDFLISMPEQSWVLKIDYKNGKGSGKVIWRLGKDGDFTVKSDDPYPWFSYQHDAGFEPVGSNILTLFDNGHARHDQDATAKSRGQVWQIDEEKRTATLMRSMNMQVYSSAVGSAQTLKNGGYSFEAGYNDFPISPFGRTVETDRDGRIVFAVDVNGLLVYRSYRVDDMYSAPTKSPTKE